MTRSVGTCSLAAVPFLILALAPTVGLLDHTGTYLASGWIAGSALVVVGVIDHLWLTRTFGHRPAGVDA